MTTPSRVEKVRGKYLGIFSLDYKFLESSLITLRNLSNSLANISKKNTVKKKRKEQDCMYYSVIRPNI